MTININCFTILNRCRGFSFSLDNYLTFVSIKQTMQTDSFEAQRILYLMFVATQLSDFKTMHLDRDEVITRFRSPSAAVL